MIKAVRLINWRSHKDTYIEFEKGANIFVGSMGSGKSSVLEAISFALFGNPSAKKGGKLMDRVRRGEERAKVELILSIDGKEVRIERELSAKKAKAKLFIDGQLKAEMASRVNPEIEKLLGMNRELFLRAVYGEQNELDLFIKMPPTDRKKYIDRLMGIEELETAIAAAREAIRILKKDVERLHVEYRGEELTKIREESKKLHNTIEELSKKLAEKESAAEKERAAFEEVKRKWQELNEKRQRWLELKAELERKRGTVEELSKEVESSEEEERSYEALEKKHAAIAKKLAEKRVLVSQLEKEIDKLKKAAAEAEAIEKQIKELVERIDKRKAILAKYDENALEKEVKSLEEALRKDEAELSSTKNELAKIKETLTYLGKADKEEKKCPVCQRPLEDKGLKAVVKYWEEQKKKLVEKGKAKMTKLNEEKSTLEEKKKLLDKIRLMSERLKTEKEELEGLEQRLDEFKGAASKEKQETLKAELKVGRDELEQLLKDEEALKAEMQEQRRRLEKAKRLEAARKDIKRLEKEFGSLGYSEDAWKEAEEVLRERQARLRAATAALDKEKTLLKELAKRYEMLLKNTKELLEKKERLEKSEAALHMAQAIKTTLEVFQAKKRKAVIEALNTSLNEFWQHLYPYADYTAARVKSEEGAYIFEVYDGEEWRVLDNVASGGERATFALALRVAMSSLMAEKLSWLILDEPTHNLDSQAIDTFVEVIKEKLPSVVEQFFIVTHDERLKEAGIGKVFIFDRGAEKKEPTQVKKL